MPSPFWARHFDRRPFLLGRMRIAAALRQFFAARDPASGVQLSFISRTGHRVGVGATNVLALFDTLTDG